MMVFFAQAVGMDQKYCDCIFLRSICLVMASFWIMFHTVLEGTTVCSECTVKALEGWNSYFFR